MRAGPSGARAPAPVSASASLLLIATLAALPAARVEASGFSILQQSPTSMGRSFAGDAAIGHDASTTFFNPAAMVRLPGNEVMAHVSLIRPSVTFSNTATTVTTPGSGLQPVDAGGGRSFDPAKINVGGGAFAAFQAMDRLWVGISATAPFGLGLDYDETYFGRYDSQKTELLTANLSPVVAYEAIPGMLSFGGGIDVQYAEATLTRALPDPLAAGGASAETDGFLRLDGSSLSVGYNLGVHATLGDTRIGLHYRSGIGHEFDGSTRVSRFGGPLAALNGQTSSIASFDLPGILALGVAHELPDPGVRLLAEARLYRWSAFDTLNVNAADNTLDQVQRFDFRDTFIVSAGAEWDVLPGLTLRTGLTFDRTPTVDEFRNTPLPDGDRVWLGLGATWAFAERFEADFAFNGAIFRNGRVDRTDTLFEGQPLETTIRTQGTAALDFLTFAAGLRYKF